jgi:hypothetical protein
VAGPEVVWSSVESIGAVRLVPTAEPVAMEFACELLRLEDCVVDAVTQAVFADGETVCSDVSWLHPRGEVLGGPPTTTAFVDRGVLAPMTGSWNVFYLLMELAAGLRVADRGGVLAGSTLVGWLPEGADRRVPEVAGLYGCAVRPRPGRAGRYTRVGTLFVPRFWIRAAGSAEGHFDVPRWAAAGYSRDLLADLRSRLLPVPAPRPSVVAYGRRAAGDADDTLTDVELGACHDAGAVLLPSLSVLGLADQAALYAQVRALVAVHGEANVNAVFLPDGARFEELFVGVDAPGQFAVLADLRGLDYAATHVASVESAEVGTIVAACSTGSPSPEQPIYVLTGVWDNADLLDDWLEHHRALGIAGVLAMDFGSTDGSVEILTSSRWSSFVDVVEFPGLDVDDSRYLVDRARERWDAGWALMIDPDEFLMTATGDLRDPALRGAMVAADLVTVPRFEMTTARSRAAGAADGRPDASDLELRLTAQDQGKVLLDLASDAFPTISSHEGTGRAQVHLTDPRTCLLHAPVRSFARFAQKVDHAAVTLSHSEDQDDGFAWHWRRWVRIREDGGLPGEYLAQFVDDDELAALLADGTYAQDARLAGAIRRARATGQETR